jgi:hypothetical protein
MIDSGEVPRSLTEGPVLAGPRPFPLVRRLVGRILGASLAAHHVTDRIRQAVERLARCPSPRLAGPAGAGYAGCRTAGHMADSPNHTAARELPGVGP